MSERTPHPHFNDRGTLNWHTRLAAAKAEARSARKAIFVELGRAACSQCRTLVEVVIPRPDVAPLLQENFIALASDADDTEAEVEVLAQNLEDAMMLPFILFLDSEGRFITGYSGVVTPPFLIRKIKDVRGYSASS